MNLGTILKELSPEQQTAFYESYIKAKDEDNIEALSETIDELFSSHEGFEDLKSDILEDFVDNSSDTDNEDKDKNKLEEKVMKEKMEKGYNDFLNESIDINEMVACEDYRKGVEKANIESSKPEKVVEKKINELKDDFKSQLNEFKAEILKALVKEEDNDEVTAKDCFLKGLEEGKAGNVDAMFEDENELFVEAFKAGLESGIALSETTTDNKESLEGLAESCGVSIYEFKELIKEGKGVEAFEGIVDAINECEHEDKDKLMEKMVVFANKNDVEFVLVEKSNKKEEEDEPKETDPDDDAENKVKQIEKMKKEMDDEEDAEKKAKLKEKIAKLEKDVKESTDLPEDIATAINEAKEGLTESEGLSLDESIAKLEAGSVDELRKGIVELLNGLNEDDDDEDDKTDNEAEILRNRYKKPRK